jgi:hypothetical protein
MTKLEVLEGALRLLVRGFNPGMPVRLRAPGFDPAKYDPIEICGVWDERAVAWDLESAIRIASVNDWDIHDAALAALNDLVPGGHAWTWADQIDRTQAEVVSLVSTAVHRLRRMQAQHGAHP